MSMTVHVPRNVAAIAELRVYAWIEDILKQGYVKAYEKWLMTYGVSKL
jgi:hypothetical protein